MSLRLLQPGIQPIGQFDGLDTDVLNFLGGEVCSLKSVLSPGQPGVTQSGFDKAAYDVFDGYVPFTNTTRRPAVFKTGLGASTRPLFLADEGILGYGTLFGAVVGGTVGQQVNGPTTYTGAVLGPHTATGSGKVTCWDKPGLYAVSLDAVDTSATNGLQPTNGLLDVGVPVQYSANGLLTPASAQGGLTTVGTTVGHLVEFATNGSLVTTPNTLVAALNSPSGNVSSYGPRTFTFAVIYFAPPQ